MKVLAFVKNLISPSPESIAANIASRNRARDDNFWMFVNETGWNVLKKGQSHKPNNTVVIGIALWSAPDVKGLKHLAQRLKPAYGNVYIFSIDDVTTIEEARQFMPGTPPFTQTPVLAEYRDGKLENFLQGRATLDWMNRANEDQSV